MELDLERAVARGRSRGVGATPSTRDRPRPAAALGDRRRLPGHAATTARSSSRSCATATTPTRARCGCPATSRRTATTGSVSGSLTAPGCSTRCPASCAHRAPLLTTEPATDECWIWMEDVEGSAGRELADRRLRQRRVRPRRRPRRAYASGRSVLPTSAMAAPAAGCAAGSTRSRVDADLVDDDAAVGRRASLRSLDRCGHASTRSVDARERAAGDRRGRAADASCTATSGPRNLIAADDGTTVAIDWSQVGIGALGSGPRPADPRPGLDAGAARRRRSTRPRGPRAAVATSSGLRSLGRRRRRGRRCGEWYAAAASVHYAPMLAMYAAPLASRTRRMPRELATAGRSPRSCADTGSGHRARARLGESRAGLR